MGFNSGFKGLRVTDLDGKLALDYQTRFRRKNWRLRMR